ncbi:MAG: carboxyl transferase domain-containing protein, partial [Candidatus Nanopelagicales bacterium]
VEKSAEGSAAESAESAESRNVLLTVEIPVCSDSLDLDLAELDRAVRNGDPLPPTGPPAAVAVALSAAVGPAAREGGRSCELSLLESGRGVGVRVADEQPVGTVVITEPVLTLVAHGADLAQAAARLSAALRGTSVVLSGAGSNRLDLMRELDRLSGAPSRALAAPSASGDEALVALLVTAVEAAETEHAAQRADFRARAEHGRPEAPVQEGVTTSLRLAGEHYTFTVYEEGPDDYRVDSGAGSVALLVHRQGPHRREVEFAGRKRELLISADGVITMVESPTSRDVLKREDGFVVRAGWPAFAVSVPVRVGQHVQPGDPLVVLEAMKMESTLTAPFAGLVTALDVLPNSQVQAGASLVRIRPDDQSAALRATDEVTGARRLSFPAPEPPAPTGACNGVYRRLTTYLLGYELSPAALKALLTDQRQLSKTASEGGDLIGCEDGFLELFSELAMLNRPRTESTDRGPTEPIALGAGEYLNAYVQWLDPDRAGLPERYRRWLLRALENFGITSLRHSPELEAAVVRLYRALGRLSELAPAVTAILERRLTVRRELVPVPDPAATRFLFDRLTTATEGRFPPISDLSRDVRFRFVDEPILAAEQAATQARMSLLLDRLAADPENSARQDLIAQLVACPQPMREVLLQRWRSNPNRQMGEILLEIRAQRWYRTRDLRDLSFTGDGPLLASADYDFEDRRIHLVMTYADLADLPTLGAAIARHLREVPPVRQPVIDLMLHTSGPTASADELSAALLEQLSAWELGRPVWRLDVTLTSLARDLNAPDRTQSLTFRGNGASGLLEDRFYRDLHPILAKRMELWRLSNFDLERLPSLPGVYLFHGRARSNPKDHRLFALGEVRDLTPALIGRMGVPSLPSLEHLGLQALISMRRARAAYPLRSRPQANRITLFLRPPLDFPREHWAGVAGLLEPLAAGAGLDMLVLRGDLRQPDGSLRPVVLNVEGFYSGAITIAEEPQRDDLVRPLTPYRQKVLTSQRFGVPYPWEILRIFAPTPGTLGRFQPSEFVELDLEDSGERLVEVHREPGMNSANLIVGRLTTFTERIPEGMTRIAILSDPTRGLGNLAEPECRRVNAALDLAAEMRIPVEWFAVSSGALISNKSGTENMDWIAATLRKIIEFTQDGGEINIVVTGINVGGQPYWNAEATMLMHTRGILIMTPSAAMVLTGKQALDFSGGVSAEDNHGIGGYDRVMGPNGQAQYWAGSLQEACELLLTHYEYTYVVPGERFPRRTASTDPVTRDVTHSEHPPTPGTEFTSIGEIFSDEQNPDRKKPFDIRAVMAAVADSDAAHLERWQRWRGGENSVVWDTTVGGIPVCMLGLESRPIPRRGYVPADGPPQWTAGTLFPQASRKTARAVNAASANRPLVVLANLSGFDGSPESMRHWQLEYGAEIGRAVTNFRGPIVFVVVSRYHGGAFVVFSKALNPDLQIFAVEGSYASVIGGAPAAATVFAREVRTRVDADRAVVDLRAELAVASGQRAKELAAELVDLIEHVRSVKLGEAADEFDSIHTIERALEVGSVDRIVPAAQLRPIVVEALENAIERTVGSREGQ